jgi:uncharacterized membrane protein/3-hydroxymyristoyl/3-hydroxydecanoyl-(acyl carrier protein) dehydratase
MPLPPQVRRITFVALAVAYPLFAHGASLLERPSLTVASVAVLAAAILVRPLTEGRRWAWIATPAAALSIVGLWRINAVALVLFLPPVLLNVFLAWLFGHTLVRGSMPLIERLVRMLQPASEPPEPAIIRYAGRLTRVWTALFVLLAAVNLGLAACVSPGGLLESIGIRAPLPVSREFWSLFANVLNYAIVVAFFMLEYAYRRRRFPDRPYRNLVDFLRRAAAAGPALMATFSATPAGAPKHDSPHADARPETVEATMYVPAEHPVYAGHFPGRPTLPGVLLLEHVIEAAEKWLGYPLRIEELPWVKFQAPLAPGDSAAIRLRREGETLHFEVRRGDARVAQGVFRIAAGRKPT